jgi:transcription initiation factor TFIIB
MRDYDCAEIVCMDCGVVIATKLADRGPEWRAFDKEQRAKRTRVGAPLTFTIHDKGLSTMIDWHDRDIYGRKLAPGQKAQIYRLRKWQRRIRVSDATERNLAFALSEISKIANNLSLPKNILETASVIYRKAVKEHLIRGRSIQGVTAAAIYLSCRQCKLARTLDEIAEASGIDKKEVGRSYRFLVRELGYFIPPVKPSQYVSKFSNQLTMQGKAEEIAHKILAMARDLRLTSGRGPTGIAAAASYIASVLMGERKTQREIAEIAQVTEVTIRNRYKELVERLLFITAL